MSPGAAGETAGNGGDAHDVEGNIGIGIGRPEDRSGISAWEALSEGDRRGGGGEGEGDGSDVVGPAPAGVGRGGDEEMRTSVVLGIPTVPRPKGVNYLEQTLQAVLAQVDEQVR